MKTVVFFDVDGTILDGNINAIVLSRLLRRKFVSPFLIFEIIFWYTLSQLRIYDNIRRVVTRAARITKGVSQEDLNTLIEASFQNKIKPALFQRALELILNHQNDGHEVILLSSSFEPFVIRLAAHIGVEKVIATKLAVHNGMYTGTLGGEIVGGRKHRIVARFMENNDKPVTYAYSDHYRDIPLLKLVTCPVATNPDFWLKRAAVKLRWPILWF
jgi:HAD superfamily hydrolase (TIGR01490 family)